MSEQTQLTTLGNLEPKIANMLCYMPVMSINLISSIAFLATEDKANERVRFHAAQGLLFTASMMVVGVVVGVLFGITPVVMGIIDGILGADGMLVAVTMLAITLAFLAFLAVVVIVPFGLSALAFMEKRVRIPVLAGIAEKLLGHGDGWQD